MEHRWAVDVATGAFLYGGAEPYDCADGLSAGQSRVVLDRTPNPALEKSGGGSLIVAKTAPEIAAEAAAAVDSAAVAQFDTLKILKAKAISDLAWRLGKAPGALTPTEINNERTRILNIYKAL